MNLTATINGLGKYWFPESTSAHGSGVDVLINVVHWFMLALFVGWGVFFVYCLMRFRQRPQSGATYEPAKAKLTKGAEIAVVLFEIVLLVGFSMPVWAATRRKAEMPTAEDNPLTVRVIAQQFQWNVHYPGPDGVFGRTTLDLIDPVENPIGLDRGTLGAQDDVVSLGWLRVPKDRPLIVRLTSLDVIHCFWIAAMRIKQDTVPGMEIPVWFTPKVTSDELRERSALRVTVPPAGRASKRFLQGYKNRIAMEDYPGFPKGAMISSTALESLQGAGVDTVTLGPLEPMEIQCAQLCGLNHYSMRGFFKVMEPADWTAWYEQAAAEALEEGEDEWGDGDWDEEEDEDD